MKPHRYALHGFKKIALISNNKKTTHYISAFHCFSVNNVVPQCNYRSVIFYKFFAGFCNIFLVFFKELEYQWFLSCIVKLYAGTLFNQ